MRARWTRRPDGSTWGDFGPDDQKGRLNLLTPEKVREGVAEVRAGRTFCLSLPLDYPGGSVLNPRRHPPRRFATLRGGEASYNYPLSRDDPAFTDVISDDAVLLHTQYPTQWDGLAHVGSLFDADGDGEPEAVYYNGWRGGEHVVSVEAPAGAAGVEAPGGARGAGGAAREGWARFEGVEARALGVEHMAVTGVQGRGVLIDLRAHLGPARTLVGYDELARVCEADGVAVEPGDIVCLYTGFADLLLEMRREPDPRRLAALPLHEHCLFALGVPLGELWYLAELAAWLRAHGRSRFLLTAPPLRLPGAVGSPVTPVATV